MTHDARSVLPEKVLILEVGPRDGFQIIKDWIPTIEKLAIIQKLVAAGIKSIEVTSFVSHKRVPQLKDAAEVVRSSREAFPEIRFSALVPNTRGFEQAVEAGIDEVVFVVCTTEALNRENFNRSRSESLKELARIVKSAEHARIRVRATVAAAFGCPYEGTVTWQQMRDTALAVRQTGVSALGLADTTGVAYPRQVRDYLGHVQMIDIGIPLSAHFHDTLGIGAANVLAAATMGVSTFESSIAGMGGCPFAPGAPGNVATESLVYMFEKEEVETGIDLQAILSCASAVEHIIKHRAVG